ncbi:hypothetical protein PV396_27020 [Streptomyces sp. ME02-8801-2C]|uniref:hypothetical protein n=1 Tax=Streptomyces sp. ME02-8801-2C TaxID=3028680 RepID=UPI00299FEAC3|nr:hypothetical protein [Streptomyces sp. ME02-8801-2C]MDX3455544.1 hypothetical protein [Streptomyces sp. ME02-8801-2C]
MRPDAHQGIRLRRRDDEDLYLTTAARADEPVRVLDATTRVFVAMTKTDPRATKMLTQALPEAFPWVRFLPKAAVGEFLVEFIETTRAAVDLDPVEAPRSPPG